MDPRPLRRFSSGLAVLALIITSCAASVSSSETESGAANPGNASSAQETEPDAAEGPTAPVLVELSDGSQLDWNSLEGKDVMLWFWAPW